MPDFDPPTPQEAGQEDGAATTEARVGSIATKVGTLLMANKLWVACALVGVIVLVEVAAVALWLLNHYPASRATTTTIPRGTQPTHPTQPLRDL